ncbi:MAG: hypothetical protein GY953_20050 [bacterium]|nr:hypothetical protein [bacterium]
MARFHLGRVWTAPLLLVLSAALCLAGGESATYVNGTITMIPANTEGRLDLGDSEALNFHYGANSFTVPYGQIVNFHLGRDGRGFGSKVSGGAAAVGRKVLPMLFSPKQSFLTIEFEGEDERAQTMVLELPAYEAKAALPVLEAHTADSEQTAAVARSADTGSGWWGDRVWRTNRNKDLWPTRPEEEQAPVGSDVEVATSKDE